MDGLINRFDATEDGDLMLCPARGVAYQRDMHRRTAQGFNAEGKNYFAHYTALQGSPIGQQIHEGRVAMVDKCVGSPFPVLDVGVGCGEFIRARPNTFGHDNNPVAIDWLKNEGKWAESLEGYQAFTFWDVLEHVDVPAVYFKRMPQGSCLFTSLPVFEDLNKVRASKHYKPGEHLYYWTEQGFIDWMALYRFRCLERQTFETDAGREGIKSFAFVRDLPDYHQTVDQYRKLYEPNYGASAYLYFEGIAKEVMALNPASILDFGCGRSDLVAHFWKDGARRIEKYDPAISQFKTMPEGVFDLAICCDVMEHILMADVDRILSSIRQKARRAIFTISLQPARKRLPDGRNAHVTLLSAAEWSRWIGSVFGRAKALPTHDKNILMLRTY